MKEYTDDLTVSCNVKHVSKQVFKEEIRKYEKSSSQFIMVSSQKSFEDLRPRHGCASVGRNIVTEILCSHDLPC